MEPNALQVFATVLVAFTMALALLGTVIPAFPGPILAWIAALIFGLVAGFDGTGIAFFAVITILTIISYVAVLRIPMRTTESRGASRVALVTGAVGAVVGFVVIPVIGFVVGGAAGVYAAERRTNPHDQAWAATKGAIIGFGVSALVQLVIGVAVAIVWLIWVVTRFEMG